MSPSSVKSSSRSKASEIKVKKGNSPVVASPQTEKSVPTSHSIDEQEARKLLRSHQPQGVFPLPAGARSQKLTKAQELAVEVLLSWAKMTMTPESLDNLPDEKDSKAVG